MLKFMDIIHGFLSHCLFIIQKWGFMAKTFRFHSQKNSWYLRLCWERVELTEWVFEDRVIVGCCCCPLQCCCAVKGAFGRVWITWNLLHQPPTRPTGPRCSFCSAFTGLTGLNTNKIANYLHWSKCKPFIDLLFGQSGAHSIQLWKQQVLFMDLYSYEPVEKFLFTRSNNKDSIYVLQRTCMKCPGLAHVGIFIVLLLDQHLHCCINIIILSSVSPIPIVQTIVTLADSSQHHWILITNKQQHFHSFFA